MKNFRNVNSWPKTRENSRFRPSRVRHGGERERTALAAGPGGQDAERSVDLAVSESVSAASESGDGKQAADDGPRFFENVNS